MDVPALAETMSPAITSLHQYFDMNLEWNIETEKIILEQHPFSVNEVLVGSELSATPLLKVLKNRNCTKNLIELLLQHGADVNFKGSLGHSSLLIYLT